MRKVWEKAPNKAAANPSPTAIVFVLRRQRLRAALRRQRSWAAKGRCCVVQNTTRKTHAVMAKARKAVCLKCSSSLRVGP